MASSRLGFWVALALALLLALSAPAHGGNGQEGDTCVSTGDCDVGLECNHIGFG